MKKNEISEMTMRGPDLNALASKHAADNYD